MQHLETPETQSLIYGMQTQSFFSIYLKTFYNPGVSFRDLLSKRYFMHGFLYMLIPLCLYTLMYVMLFLGNGAPSAFAPWLNIPREEYYFYNQFLIAPSMVLAWLAAAAYMQVICHARKGTGSFEATLSVLGLSVSVAMWATLLHDLAMSFLSMIHFIDAKQHEIAMNTPTIWRAILWICFALYFFAFTILFYKTARVVHRLNRIQSFIIGFSTFVLFQLVFLIFNR